MAEKDKPNDTSRNKPSLREVILRALHSGAMAAAGVDPPEAQRRAEEYAENFKKKP